METLENLLTTNIPPDDEEEEDLKQFVSQCDDRLKIINASISELEAHLKFLNNEKAAILKVVAPFKRVLSPFRRLPEDVVREIFVACLETRRNPTMANTEAPVLLTQISSATRQIALSTPALWSAIHIPIPSHIPLEFMDHAKSAMATRAKGVEEWLLRRSGNLPLHISVFQNGPSSSEEPDSLADDIIGVLRACSSRWKSLALLCPETSLSQISSVSQSDAPLLHSLAIQSDLMQSLHSSFWKNSKILAIPTLRRLSQSGTASVLDYPVNWANLTYLRCEAERSMVGTNTFSLEEVLRRATCLISLHLSLFGGSSIQIEDISLPYLKSLAIDEYLPGLWNEFQPPRTSLLEFINAPALETVSYNIAQGGDAISDSLSTLLTRSPNVQELSMGAPDIPETIELYLRLCPSLRSLCILGTSNISNVTIDTQNAFLQSFVLDDPTQCLCPKLEHIRIEVALKISLNILLDFIMLKKGTNRHLSRWKAVVLKVQYCHADKDLIDKLRSEEVRGDIKLKISYDKQNDFTRNLNEGLYGLRETTDEWLPAIVNCRTTDFF